MTSNEMTFILNKIQFFSQGNIFLSTNREFACITTIK